MIIPIADLKFILGTNSSQSILGDCFVLLPVAAADADPADTLALNDNRITTFHRRPIPGSCGQRKTQSVEDIESLPCAPFDVVGRLFEAAVTALVVEE